MKQLEKDLNYIHKNFDKKKIFFNKIILITGYNGFIGYQLSRYLIKFQKELKIKKLYLTDIKIKNKKVNSKVFIKNFNVSKDSIKKTFEDKINIIIHAASIASPVFYRKEPIKTIDSNVIGLKKILDYAAKYKLDRILYFSSSEIYGNPDKKNIPTKETYNGNVSCVGPRACYDEAKRLCETLCYNYNSKHKIPVRVVRPFNNFGPGMKLNDGRLPADLAQNILNNKNINIYSNGRPTRAFCYVSDAIVGYLKVLAHHKYDYFNIGNDTQEIEVKNFTKKFLNLAKQILKNKNKIKIIYVKNKDKNYLKDNPDRRCPNLDKAKKFLNFNPQINLDEGLKRFINYLKEKYE